MYFFYENFGYLHMGPWNEVIQKSEKEYFKTERRSVLQNHRTSHYILQKKSCTTRPKPANDGWADTCIWALK